MGGRWCRVVPVDETRRTRRRGKALEGPILDAAWQELAERGWAGFSMSRVATRAGASKASLYARWPNRVALVRAAATHVAATHTSPPMNGGDLREDLLATLRIAAAFQDGPFGEALRGMVAEAKTADTTALTMFTDEMPVQAVVDIVAAAQRQGRLAPGPRPTRVVNLGLTLLSHYFLVNGRVPSDAELVDIVTDTWLPLLERAVE